MCFIFKKTRLLLNGVFPVAFFQTLTIFPLAVKIEYIYSITLNCFFEVFMARTLREAYGKYFKEMLTFSKAPDKIDATTIYQEANLQLTKYMDMMLDENLLSGSGLGNEKNFKDFYDAVVKEGKSGLILMEHFTNLDLPEILYLLKNNGTEWGEDFSRRIVAIAGMKLNEASPEVKIWTEGFTRVVIYPTRSLDKIESENIDKEVVEEEEAKARKINFAAMRAMDACKRRGQVILVFPSGTRYRPGKPETKRGLREIDSYLRLFDVMLLVSINGEALKINMETPDDMLSDYVEPANVVLTASPVIDCKKFRDDVLASLPADEADPKQKTVDRVMQLLEEQHNRVASEKKLAL